MALIFLGAAYQDSDKKEAANYLRKAIKTTKDVPTLALQGLLNCCESPEVPDICEQLLKLTPEKFEDLHKRISEVARNELAVRCVQALKYDAELEHTEDNGKRIESAHIVMGQIYLNYPDNFIDDVWNALVCLNLYYIHKI